MKVIKGFSSWLYDKEVFDKKEHRVGRKAKLIICDCGVLFLHDPSTFVGCGFTSIFESQEGENKLTTIIMAECPSCHLLQNIEEPTSTLSTQRKPPVIEKPIRPVELMNDSGSCILWCFKCKKRFYCCPIELENCAWTKVKSCVIPQCPYCGTLVL